MYTGTKTGQKEDQKKEGFAMMVRRNREVLRRGLMIALVLAIILNRIIVYAKIEGEPDYMVYNYDDLVSTLENAQDSDKIGIYGVVYIPPKTRLENVTFVRMNDNAQIVFLDTTYSVQNPSASVENVHFEGNNIVGNRSFVEVQYDVTFKYSCLRFLVFWGIGNLIALKGQNEES